MTRVARSVAVSSRFVWIAFTAGLYATAATTAVTGVAVLMGDERRLLPRPVVWTWAVCGVVVLVGAIISARALRPTRGWQEMCDALLIVVVVTMAVTYATRSAHITNTLPDPVLVVVVTLAVVIVLSAAFAIGRWAVARGASVGPMGVIFGACVALALVVIVFLTLPARPAGLAVSAALTVLAAVLWMISGHLRLGDNQAVRMLLPRARPSIWYELLPAVVLMLLVLEMFLIGGVGSLIGALVAAGIVAVRMTLTLVQYRRLLDEERERLTAYERTLIEERYARFAMEETQSELAEDNARLQGQERDRLGVLQLMNEAVLLPGRDLRTDIARMADDPDAVPAPLRERMRRMGVRADGMHRSLEDLLTYSLIVERQLVMTRGPVNVDALVQDVIRGLSDVMDRSGVSLQIDGKVNAVVHGDAVLLSRVLRRLIESALTASTRSCAVTVLLRASDDLVVIEISDRGPGYAADELPYLCIPFYRPRSGGRGESDGVGLALANARSIMAMHGGAIRVGSPSRGGVQIRLSLPIHRIRRGLADVRDDRSGGSPDDETVALHVDEGGRP